ncbi:MULTISPECIES: Rieske (2Fe-2S) protein [Pseudomonas]|uniref:Rieske 2Fe-2S domain-containing protein n=1 Tax=Pseudomonas eucalypticola TaxID=2599595 RepID=A0A7D5H5S3_9PSED|nr:MULTISPECIES: Rieske 2Fe-2S domain-containing protein [Pseudomonas]QKZ04543.1 Rieske 2Fe-2S domain-containing protein [Pseudomonas eucalypticola]
MSSDLEELTRAETFNLVVADREYQVPHQCPHREGWLEHGMVNEGRRTITCPLHFSVFCLETGKQLGGPECGSLKVKRLR